MSLSVTTSEDEENLSSTSNPMTGNITTLGNDKEEEKEEDPLGRSWYKEVIDRIPHFVNLSSDLLFMISLRNDRDFFVFAVTINILQVIISALMGWLKVKLILIDGDIELTDTQAVLMMFYFGTIGPSKTFTQSIKFINLLTYGNDNLEERLKISAEALSIMFHVVIIDVLQLIMTISYSNRNGYTLLSTFSIVMSFIMVGCVGVPGLMCHIYYVTCS